MTPPTIRFACVTAMATLLGAFAAGTPAVAQGPVQAGAAFQAVRATKTADTQGLKLLARTIQAAQVQRSENGQTKMPVSHLNLPYALALDHQGNLYAANVLGNNVAVYNSKRQFVGALTGNLVFPSGVGVNFEGDIFVANNASNSITVFAPDWTPTGAINDPALQGATGLTVDADDTVWALDASGTLHGYMVDGTILPAADAGGATALGAWGPNIAVWGAPDPAGGYDQFFGNRGLAARSDPPLSEEFQGGSPQAGGAASDGAGTLYVTDTQNNAVQIWATNGTSEALIASFPVPSEPTGVAVDPALKRIYVALPLLNEVVIYSSVAPYKQMAVLY